MPGKLRDQVLTGSFREKDPMEHFSRFSDEFLKALKNLLPIVVI
ncbi:hypothetical protein [Arthrobacter sp.]|nr:hypothetical protein [Arthrobacter sp.]